MVHIKCAKGKWKNSKIRDRERQERGRSDRGRSNDVVMIDKNGKPREGRRKKSTLKHVPSPFESE